MANVKAMNVEKYSGTGYSPIDASAVYGKQRVWLDEYTADSLPVNDTISFAVMEKGFVLLDIVIKQGALGGSVSAKVGDADDDDRYISVAASATARTFSLVNNGSISELNKRFTSDTTLQVKFNHTITGSIKFQVFYTVE